MISSPATVPISQMRWIPTSQSSNVAAFAYDHDARTLHVRFKSGHAYAYSNVDPSHYDGLQNADSVGKYINEHIKDQHETKRIG